MNFLGDVTGERYEYYLSLIKKKSLMRAERIRVE